MFALLNVSRWPSAELPHFTRWTFQAPSSRVSFRASSRGPDSCIIAGCGCWASESQPPDNCAGAGQQRCWWWGHQNAGQIRDQLGAGVLPSATGALHLCNVVRYTHTHPFNGPFSWTTRVSWYQKGKTNLDFTEASDSDWQWQQLGHVQVCTLLQTDSHASTRPLIFFQAGRPSCRPTNSIKALKAAIM